MPRRSKPEPFHPDLRRGRWLPPLSVGPRSLRLFRGSPKGLASTSEVTVAELDVPGAPGERPYRVFRPATSTEPTAVLFWIHGGGLISGTPSQDDRTNLRLAAELGITVFAASYRLAPEHPGPAALDDLVAGYRFIVDQADDLNIDATRIAIGGASAGGGLAAALAQRLHDEGGTQPVFQLLVYPMLDDRTVARTDHDTRNVRVWTPKSNRYGWTSYLAGEPGGADIAASLVPARRQDLSGLPPAWVGVGSLDLFHDEDIEYARRLEKAGVRCEVSVVPGAFHGFDALLRTTEVTRRFHDDWVRVLRAALTTGL